MFYKEPVFVSPTVASESRVASGNVSTSSHNFRLPLDSRPRRFASRVVTNSSRQYHKNCTVSDNSRKLNVSPTFTYKSSDNRPYVTLKIFDRNLACLLDTGANRSVIGRFGLKFLKLFSLQLLPSDIVLSTADGSEQSVAGSVLLPISVGGVVKLLDILVVPSLQHDVLLGMDFVKEFELSVDFKNNSYDLPIPTVCSSCCRKETPNVIQDRADLSPEQQTLLLSVVDRFQTVSWQDGQRLGRTSLIEHDIDTGDAKPVKQRQYPLSPYMMEHLLKELDHMLALKVVRPSTSPWSSPVLLVKKSNGERRFCFDGRKLNSLTKPDAYPLPLVNHILSMLAGAKFLTSIDLKSAFWQIPLSSASREKTAFAVPGRGLYEFEVMPFGLRNAPQTQQRLMDRVLGPDLEPFVFVYLDDIIIATPTFEKHIEVLREVLSRFQQANLTVNLSKCNFCRSSLKFLGFVVDKLGLRTDPDKVAAMLNYSRPRTTTEVKRFIGLCSWYRRFIPHFSSLTAPITGLIKNRQKGQKIEWNEDAERSFLEIKRALVSAPVLANPNFDKPFTVQCDASDLGLGCVLTQTNDDNTDVPVAFASRTLSAQERNYSTTEKECLAVLFGIEKFRPYIEGSRFKVLTDHHSLLWLQNLKDPTGRLARWAVRIQQFDVEFEHRKGSMHVVPDALSRSPIEIFTLTFNNDVCNSDPWYQRMIHSVLQHPNEYERWRVIDGRLYKRFPISMHQGPNRDEWKTVVPKRGRRGLLEQFHSPPPAGHFGIAKTLYRLAEQYYWPKMKVDVSKFIARCRVCASQKVSHTARPGFMGQHKQIKFPWQLVGCDIVGPLPKTKSGYRFILVVVDWFTKFSLLKPLKQADAPSIASYLENEVFLMFGAPQFLLTDNGTEFTARRIQRLLDNYGVKHWYTAKYHAQANFVERVNRTIGTAIRSYLSDSNHQEWDKVLPQIGFALRTAVHDSTGFVPTFLNFGRFVPLNGKYYGELGDRDPVELNWSCDFYASQLQEQPAIYHQVRQHLADSYARQALAYNRGKRPAERYEVGDYVWKRHYILSNGAHGFSSKLAPKFIACRVRKVISPLIYELDNEDGYPVGRWHVKDLKPYVVDTDSETSSDAHSETSGEAPNDVPSGSHEEEVHVISSDSDADDVDLADQSDPVTFASDDSVYNLFDP